MQVREICTKLTSVVLLLIVTQIVVENGDAFTSSKIPEHLSACYNDSMNLWPRGQHPPLYTRTLVELVRKLEHNRSDPNLRLFSNALLHTAKLDGVQRGSVTNSNLNLIPYRASGYEFIRHQLLIDHLTPGQVLGPQFPENLKPHELCLLHFIISESLMRKSRGDELSTCPMIHDKTEIGNDNGESQCPMKMGVMHTQWGSVSVGPLISGIASALQRDHIALAKLIAVITAINESNPQENNTFPTTRDISKENVSTTTTTTTISQRERGRELDKEEVDNIWVATLGGILAQVVVNQVSAQPRVLSAGKWNDTLLPRTFYLNAYHWDVNNADILGGIDALILSMEIRKWLDQYPAVRLFQLIDMYYSPRGIAYDPSFRACNRFNKLDEVLSNHDLVHQVSTIAKLLNEYGDYKNSVDINQIQMLSEAVVKEFKSARASIISGWQACEEPTSPDNGNSNDINTPGARWEILLVTDHSYSNYDIQQLLAALAETADVSHFSSSIGLLHGNEGKWLINVTNDIVEIFSALATLPSNEWPTGLSLTRCMHQIITYYQSANNSQDGMAFERQASKPYGKLIAVLAQSSSLTDSDLLGVQHSIDTLRGMSPETHIVYVTSAANERSFAQLAQYTRSQVAVLEAAGDVGAAVEVLAQAIRVLPASIVDVFAGTGGKSNFEDYLTPYSNADAHVYEINGVYAAAANVSVKFQGRGYGDLSICPYAFTDGSLASSTPTQRLEAMNTNECKRIASSMVSDEVTFNAEDYCPPRDETCSVRFAVAAANSTIKCAEVECRYPDQILLMIETSWTNSSPTLMFSTSCLSFSLLVAFVLLL